MRARSAKEFLSKFNDFLQALETAPLVKRTINDEEQLVHLFRFWYMDCREQEVIAEADRRAADDPFGMGMLGDDGED